MPQLPQAAPTWDWTAVAALESQISGLLACFVFAAIVLLLSNPPSGKKVRDISTPLFSSLVVFFSLVVSAFLLAIVVGNKAPDRAAVAFMLANFVFALAGVQMFHCLVWFFADYQVSAAVLSKTRLLYHEVTLIAGSLLAISVSGIAGESLWTLAPVVLLPALGMAIRKPLTRGRTAEAIEAVVARLMSASSLLTVGLAIYEALVNHADNLIDCYSPWAGVIITWVIGLFFLICELTLPPAPVKSLTLVLEAAHDSPLPG